jgi:hypothetical protein
LLNEGKEVKTVSIFFGRVPLSRGQPLQPEASSFTGLRLQPLKGRFCKKRVVTPIILSGDSPIFGLWPWKCFFPYTRFLYGLHHALGEEREPAPRLYILHFHGFYVHIVDPHVVMTNKKKAFQFCRTKVPHLLQRICSPYDPILSVWKFSASSPVEPILYG